MIGDTIAQAGQSMQSSGQGVKNGGIGGVGLGASMLGWGMDSSTVHNQLQSSPQLADELSSLVKPIDALINDVHPAAAQTTLPVTQQPQTESVNATTVKPNV
jgi:hypothetical protein